MAAAAEICRAFRNNGKCRYGDECKFGGGKTLREGMGQATGATAAEALDYVITNALIVDVTGIGRR